MHGREFKPTDLINVQSILSIYKLAALDNSQK